MSALLQIKKQELHAARGSWVHIKHGKYQGDLAQVVEVLDNGDVALKSIPRIDLSTAARR